MVGLKRRFNLSRRTSKTSNPGRVPLPHYDARNDTAHQQMMQPAHHAVPIAQVAQSNPTGNAKASSKGVERTLAEEGWRIRRQREQKRRKRRQSEERAREDDGPGTSQGDPVDGGGSTVCSSSGSRSLGRGTGGAFYVTLVPIRPRRRGERRSLRTFPGASLRAGSLAFNPRPRRLSTPFLTPFNSTPTSGPSHGISSSRDRRRKSRRTRKSTSSGSTR